MDVLASLFSSDDRSVCVIAVCGVMLCLSMIAFAAYAVVMHPETFSLAGYAAGGTSLLGGIGAARRLRDGSPPPPSAQ